MKEVSFNSVQVGDRLPAIYKTISQEVIDLNAVASLDYNPVHVNVEWTRKNKIFGIPETVAHGMMTMSLMASVIDSWSCSSGANISMMEAKFIQPVPVGEHLTCSGFIQEVHLWGQAGNFIVANLETHNSKGELVAFAKARVQFPD